jgi:hypothetical protein
MATCSQSGGRRAQGTAAPGGGRDAFETKQEIYFTDRRPDGRLIVGALDEYVLKEWDRDYTHVNFEERYAASMAPVVTGGERDGFLEQIEYQYHADRGYVTTKLTRNTERQLKNRVVYQYQQDRLWSESLQEPRGRVISTFEYAYDSRGNQTSRVILNRAGARMAETVYSYNNQGQMTESRTRDASGETVISRTTYAYDGSGNLVREQVYNSDGALTSVRTLVWRDGKEMSNVMTDARGTVQLRITNEYGTNGELVKKTIENLQGDSSQTLVYEYAFRPARRQS